MKRTAENAAEVTTTGRHHAWLTSIPTAPFNYNRSFRRPIVIAAMLTIERVVSIWRLLIFATREHFHLASSQS
jgi:hypothetical protein